MRINTLGHAHEQDPTHIPTPVSPSAPLFLFADDGRATFLGKLTTNKFDSQSIFHNFGIYGSKFSPTSIFNDMDLYGSSFQFGVLSIPSP